MIKSRMGKWVKVDIEMNFYAFLFRKAISSHRMENGGRSRGVKGANHFSKTDTSWQSVRQRRQEIESGFNSQGASCSKFDMHYLQLKLN